MAAGDQHIVNDARRAGGEKRAPSRYPGFRESVHGMRRLAHALCGCAVAMVLYEKEAGWPVLCLLLASAIAWPILARVLTARASDPRASEFRNLVIDSALGGFWIAVMQFNLLPSALLLLVSSMDKVGLGGWRFLGTTASVLAIACVLTSAPLGFPFDPQSSMPVVLASLPALVVYPIALSSVLHALGMRIRDQNRLLERLNRSDELTALPNRKHFEDVASHELARHFRSRRPSVLMLIDVDNFKEVNDRHGHAVGDEVLRTIATVLRQSIRDIDTPARFGGDEFAVLLTETDQGSGMGVAERIRTAFLAARPQSAEREGCTLSIGVAGVDRMLITVEDWIKRADAAMYRAKSGGRNRVETY